MGPTFCFTERKLFETLVKVNTKHVQPYDLGHLFFKQMCSLASDELRASGGSTHAEVKEAGSRAQGVPMALALDNDAQWLVLNFSKGAAIIFYYIPWSSVGDWHTNAVSVVCRIKCPWKTLAIEE